MVNLPKNVYLLLILIGLFFIACQKSESTIKPEEPVPTTPTIPFSTEPSLPTAESLNAIDLVPGFNSGQMPLSEGKSIKAIARN